jgi:bacteriorhodopsin
MKRFHVSSARSRAKQFGSIVVYFLFITRICFLLSFEKENMLLTYTVYLSLFVQIVTGLVDALALQLQVPSKILLLRQALVLEFLVQIVEGIFYIWLVFAIQKKTINITPNRYYDWFLTTPTMLFTLMVYLEYLKDKEKKQTLLEFAKKYQETIRQVVVLNAMMLIFGYCGERNLLPTPVAVFFGFLPFVAYYTILYQTFVRDNPEGQTFYWYFVVVWSVYGFAALLPYHSKNILYNILDLFAKNFFGIFLAFLLYKNRLSGE